MSDPRSAERAALAAAIAAGQDAESALERARSATNAGRALLADLTAEMDRADAVDQGIAADRSADLVAAIRAGRTPTFAAAPALPDNAEALADLTNRRRAAEVAVRTLAEAEHDAERQVYDAKTAVGNAVKAALIAEAETLAERLESLDAQATPLKALLGGEVGFVSRLPAPLSPRLVHAIRSVDFVVNTTAYREMSLAEGRWTDFAAALASDPDARLT